MSQMPEQKYRCSNCGYEIKARTFEAFCPLRGCHWERMDAVMSPSSFETDVEPKHGEPALGCLVLLVLGGVSFFVLYSIVMEVLL